MRAVVVDRFVEPRELRVSDVEAPRAGEGEVIVDVAAAGCNFFDTLIIRGKYQVKPAFPFSPGGEVAGVVRELGPGVDDLPVGTRVMANVGHGGFAERAVAGRSVCHPMPDTMSFEEAAAFPIVYGTAFAAVVVRGRVRSGETVLVTAAAGGVGLASIQVAKARGARAIALASGSKLEATRRAGADVAIDYRQTDWVDRVNAETEGRGVDVVVENVGGDVFDGCTRCIAWGGRLVVSGFTSGKIPEVKVNRVMLKHISIVGLHWGPMREHEPTVVDDAYVQLRSMYEAGVVKPLVSKTYPLDRVGEALEALGSRGTVGKIVVVPGGI